MSHRVPSPRRPLLAAIALAVALMTPAVAAPVVGAAPTTKPVTPAKTVVLHLTGRMTMELDPAFVRTLRRSGASVAVRSGAAWSSRRRTVTLPVDANAAVLLDGPAADIPGTGTVAFRRKDSRKVTLQAVTLRLRPNGLELASTIRKRTGQVLSPLTISPTTDVETPKTGVRFANLQMLVSDDLARAARAARIKGVKEGALLGLLTAEVEGKLPTVKIPSLTAPGGAVTVPGIDLTQLPTIPGIDLTNLPNLPGIDLTKLDPSTLPTIPGIDLTNLPKIPNLDFAALLKLLGIDPATIKVPQIDLPSLPSLPTIDEATIREFLRSLGLPV